MRLQLNSRWTVLGTALLGLLLSLALSFLLGFPAAADVPESDKGSWQQRYADLITRARDSEQRVHESKAAYNKAKQRGRLRGEYKVTIMENMKTSEEDFARDQKALDEFPEMARQEGVPPGWLREVEDRAGIDG
jgi:hypothetical protein